MKYIAWLLGTLLSSFSMTSAAALAPDLIPPLTNPNRVITQTVPLALPRPQVEATFSYGNNPQVVQAYQKYLKEGKAPNITAKGFVTLPYQTYQQVMLPCAPLHLCVIQLETNEQINHIDLGDSAHWLVSTSRIGTEQQGSYQIVVKPQQPNTATDMVITTNKRAYNLGLISKSGETTHVLSFYYPEEALNHALEEAKQQQQLPLKKQVVEQSAHVNLEQLNFNYRLRGTLRQPRPIWQPTRVFDDGHKTYIQMPKVASESDLPVLYLINGREKTLVNYRYQTPYYVIDGLFERAILVSGKGHRQQRVMLTNNQWPPHQEVSYG